MACLARFCRLTGLTAQYEEEASEALKQVLAKFDASEAEKMDEVVEENWDEGEVIVREEIVRED
jgi:ribonuclease MRP protein subunit RMP1